MIRLWLIVAAAMLCAASSVLAAPFTSNGTGGGNWSSAATWGGAGVPGAGDTVTITGGDTVSVTDTQFASTILIETASTLRIDSSGFLTVGAAATAVTINAPVVPANSSLEFFGGTMTLTNGGLAVDGDPRTLTLALYVSARPRPARSDPIWRNSFAARSAAKAARSRTQA